MKAAFLSIIDYAQNNTMASVNVLRYLLYHAINMREKNKVKIEKIPDGDRLLISQVVEILDEHFSSKYSIH